MLAWGKLRARRADFRAVLCIVTVFRPPPVITETVHRARIGDAIGSS
jgi:hypothetical protein